MTLSVSQFFAHRSKRTRSKSRLHDSTPASPSGEESLSPQQTRSSKSPRAPSMKLLAGSFQSLIDFAREKDKDREKDRGKSPGSSTENSDGRSTHSLDTDRPLTPEEEAIADLLSNPSDAQSQF